MKTRVRSRMYGVPAGLEKSFSVVHPALTCRAVECRAYGAYKQIPRCARDDKTLERTVNDKSTSELHLWDFAFRGSREFEELAWLESEHTRKNVARERLDLGVVIANDRVVIAPRVLDRVFNFL